MTVLLNRAQELGIVLGLNMIPFDYKHFFIPLSLYYCNSPHNLDLALYPELEQLAVAGAEGEADHLGGVRAELLHQERQPTHADLPILNLILEIIKNLCVRIFW